MSITELKQVCHVLVEQIDDKKVLEDFVESIKNYNESSSVDFWNELTESQKKDLEEAWIESEDESNLISHDEVMKQAREWIKK